MTDKGSTDANKEPVFFAFVIALYSVFYFSTEFDLGPRTARLAFTTGLPFVTQASWPQE